jgi:inhibitor of KinA sporulation pathway (predicted exonuclease)|tara:strand:- start:1650 stop:1946 length:297 start_codon:yes stop_codon:yes gene_type:complete
MINLVAWKEAKNDDETVSCKIQLNFKDKRRVKTVLKELQEWETSGEGYNSKNKQNILILRKIFKDVNNWRTFLKKFPYRIVEKTPTGKEKVYNAKKTI